MAYQHILVPVDGSQISFSAVKQASQLTFDRTIDFIKQTSMPTETKYKSIQKDLFNF